MCSQRVKSPRWRAPSVLQAMQPCKHKSNNRMLHASALGICILCKILGYLETSQLLFHPFHPGKAGNLGPSSATSGSRANMWVPKCLGNNVRGMIHINMWFLGYIYIYGWFFVGQKVSQNGQKVTVKNPSLSSLDPPSHTDRVTG